MFSVVYAAAQPSSPGGAAGTSQGPQSGQEFASRVTEFSLSNGLHFVVLERHDSPVVSFHTYVRAGAANVPAGQSGLAQLLERLAWKGTETVGTRDWPAEKKALDVVEEAYDRLDAERARGPRADGVKITSLQIEAQMAASRAQNLEKPGAYSDVLADNGATGQAASVSADSIQYTCTLPSNRAELWFSLESQRLIRPVLRDFYTERDALAQQVRAPRTANPETRVLDGLAAAAFLAHPYRNPVTGWPGDLENLRTADMRAFIDRYFVPGNLTIAIAGDVTPADARRLADRYFSSGTWAARPLPPAIHTQEPPQTAPRTAIAITTTNPLVAIGYRRPDHLDRDDAAFDLIQAILSGGSEGWLGRDLVRTRGVALLARAQATFPGGRYPGLFTILVAPVPNQTLAQTEAAVTTVLDRLRNQPVDDATLARANALIRELTLRNLEQNATAAALLAVGAADFGDARSAFTDLDRLAKITPADVQRVAVKYFVPEHRTLAYSGLPGPGVAAPAAGGSQ